MKDNEAILDQVRELFGKTMNELIEIKDTLIVLRSSERNIAEDYTWLGVDALDMIIRPLSICVQKFRRFTKKTINFSELSQSAKEVDSIFQEHLSSFVRILELYIIYTQTDLSKSNLIGFKKDAYIEDLEVIKSNGMIANKLYDRLLDIFNETERRIIALLPKELKADAA